MSSCHHSTTDTDARHHNYTDVMCMGVSGIGWPAYSITSSSSSIGWKMTQVHTVHLQKAFDAVADVAVQALSQSFAPGLAKILRTIQEIPEFNNVDICDKQVSDALSRVKKAANLSFIYGRAYIGKVSSLAEYICTQESNVIKVVESENIVELGDYFEEVLSMSVSCQKDIKGLLEIIEEENVYIGEQEKAISDKKDSASIEAESFRKKAVLETAITAIGASAVSIGKVVGIASIGTPVGMIVGGSLVLVGMISALTSYMYAIKSSNEWQHRIDIVESCKKAIATIKSFKEALLTVKLELEKVNAGLEAEIKAVFKADDVKCQMERVKAGMRHAKFHLIMLIKSSSEGTKRLQKYCQPLKNSESLETFMEAMQYTVEQPN